MFNWAWLDDLRKKFDGFGKEFGIDNLSGKIAEVGAALLLLAGPVAGLTRAFGAAGLAGAIEGAAGLALTLGRRIGWLALLYVGWDLFKKFNGPEIVKPLPPEQRREGYGPAPPQGRATFWGSLLGNIGDPRPGGFRAWLKDWSLRTFFGHPATGDVPVGNQGLVRHPDGSVGTPHAGGLARPGAAPSSGPGWFHRTMTAIGHALLPSAEAAELPAGAGMTTTDRMMTPGGDPEVARDLRSTAEKQLDYLQSICQFLSDIADVIAPIDRSAYAGGTQLGGQGSPGYGGPVAQQQSSVTGYELSGEVEKTLGTNPIAAAGITSNLMAESSGRSDVEYGGGRMTPGSRLAAGLAGWLGVRRLELEHFAQKMGYDPRTRATQLQFLKYDLATHYPELQRRMEGAHSAQEAADMFYEAFERAGPANRGSHLSRAEDILRHTAPLGGRPAQQAQVPATSGGGVTVHQNTSTTVTVQGAANPAATASAVAGVQNRVHEDMARNAKGVLR
jgi:hypothetical protein